MRPDPRALDPGGEPARRGAERKPRQQRQHVAPPRQPAAPPPENHEQGGGQRRRDGLGQKREEEQPGRQGVRGAAAAFIEAEVGEGGAEIQHGGKRVLLLGDPGHGFDAYGMQGEKQRREPGAGHRQPSQDHAEQAGGGGMEQDVEQVVAQRRVTPQAVLDPKRRVQERVVLLRGADLEPDASQSVQRLQIRSGDMPGVVPDESAPEGGKIGDQGRAENQRAYPPRRPGRHASRPFRCQR